jgi:hypothetical protein
MRHNRPVQSNPQPAKVSGYRWPLFLALGVVLGILLAVLWMQREVERTRFRSHGFPNPGVSVTNSAAH